MKILKIIAKIILYIGGLNVGIVGAADYDILWNVTGQSEGIIRTFYVLVGISTLVLILGWIMRPKKMMSMGSGQNSSMMMG